ncbi:dual specificity protein phosphatase family protein [Jeotgalibacillus sp. ET6]|uniref:protein-tyrosine phosphatase family protein n=1 Tax=Jeotgalibacillus sp. ET6 TaxID=3037260 RepID=UPI0024183BE6|nr:dual specificity protein phosphatase family protein [Jeotgalibacillus sp. ET6]MDG5472775.1 dual specificity protein phosphatase family protein [Jeotgalibacillus sp. ET6]
MTKNYQPLIDQHIWIGGADDAVEANTNEQIDIIFDLRSENQETTPPANRVHLPITDDAAHQDESVKQAVEKVKEAVDQKKKVYFHCSGGKNRTGTLAAALLLEYKKASTVDEAVEKAKEIRSVISPKPEMIDVLKRLYPTKA